jgi:von Willebrand factor type A domain
MGIGDMPDFEPTMRLALNALRTTDAAQKHVIVISDGDASAPSPAVIQGFIDAKITVSTIAIGYGQHVVETALRDIAKKTGGRFYPVRNPRTLPQIFVKESKVVRRPLLVDQPFTPQVAYARSDLLTGIDPATAIPQLGGMVLTTPRRGLAITPLVRVTDDGEDPVLAHWQRGLGRVVAFTSGYWPIWGTNWTGWDHYAKFWAQAVRWTMRQEAPANFDTYTTVEGTRGRIVVEALDKNADYLNFLNLQSKVIHPSKGAIPVEFVQTGPGHYEANFDIDQSGQYIANIAIYQNGEYNGSIHTGVSMPFSPELRELATNEATLRQIAEITGGRWLDMDAAADQVFNHDLPPTESKQAIWSWTIAWLLLPLFLLDVSTRRLSSWLALTIIIELTIIVFLLFGAGLIYNATWWGILGVLVLAELIGWTMRYRYIGPMLDWLTHNVTALGQSGQRSKATVDQLKTARERIKHGQAGSTSPTPTTGPTSPGGDSKVRFDAGEPTASAQTTSLRETLGGATADAPAKDQPKSNRSDSTDEKQQQDMTSRLLKAKRRAKRDIDKNKGEN